CLAAEPLLHAPKSLPTLHDLLPPMRSPPRSWVHRPAPAGNRRQQGPAQPHAGPPTARRRQASEKASRGASLERRPQTDIGGASRRREGEYLLVLLVEGVLDAAEELQPVGQLVAAGEPH